MPVTTPVEEPATATEGLLLDQEPPVEVVVINMEEPTQTVDAPEIAAGEAFTVILFVAVHAPTV
jgi:AmiR/NasT family two-component response regulator